ncbi:hypothetical protein VTI74DRAFT_1752 [Chaetomium olivicolor]
MASAVFLCRVWSSDWPVSRISKYNRNQLHLHKRSLSDLEAARTTARVGPTGNPPAEGAEAKPFRSTAA